MNQLNREFKISETQKNYKQSNFLYAAIFFLFSAAAMAAYMIWHYYTYGQWSMDGVLQSFMKGIRAPWLDRMFRGITAAGETLPVVGATAAIVITFVFKKKFMEAAIFAIHMLGVWQLNEYLKMLFQRPRPDASLHLVEISHYNLANSYSLPSGHSMNFMALMLLSIYFIWIFSKNKKLNVSMTVMLFVCGLLTGISRVYLNVHYISDVLTGWSISVAFTSITIIVHCLICRKKMSANI